jgi:hypothetical protein
MIKGINSSGPYINVSNGMPGSPYITPRDNNPAIGMVRMNGQSLEAFDGSGWISIANTYADVSLNGAAITALEWCQKKMAEESRIKELAAKNVTVADALAKFEQAQEQLKMVLTLTDQV